MSKTLSESTIELPSGPPTPTHERRLWSPRAVIPVVVALLVALIVVVWATGLLAGSTSGNPGPSGSTALATVRRQSLSSQTQVNAILGYSGAYNVVLPGAGPAQSQGGGTQTSVGSGQSAGTLTGLPAPGQVVSLGQGIYSVNGSPTVLLYGLIPAYRTLSEGMSGADVQQLNSDLVALGDASTSDLDPNSNYFSSATASGVEQLQANLGVTQTGTLSLGQAVFLPGSIRVASVSATLGAPAQPGAVLLQATSTTRAVVAQLDADQQSEVKVGDKVTITLPSNRTTPGVVSTVGSVATAPSSQGSAAGGGSSTSGGSSSGGSSAGSGGSGGSGSPPTIEVEITPLDPAATGTLDQAPVSVAITTAVVNDALVVPIDALLAVSAGHFAVDVVGTAGSRNLVPVTTGLFDDAEGLVQVTGRRLSPGDRVAVPKL